MATFADAVSAAAGFIGNLTGNVIGNVQGNLTGNVQGNVAGNLNGNVQGGIIQTEVNLSVNGAVPVPSTGTDYYITKAGILADTIIAPTAGTDDGKKLTIWSETAFAHTLTCAADGFNAKGSSGVLTWNGSIGSSVIFVARAGHWYVLSLNGVTAS